MLNKSQQTAYQQIKAFLLNPEQKYLTLSAPAGYGKSFLLNYIQEQWTSLNKQRQFLQLGSLDHIQFACTTNKAAAVLTDSKTVHKTFGLTVRNDYKTGETFTTTTTKTKDLGKVLLVVDEASMLDQKQMSILDEYTSQAKVIFVGDEYQLAPVGSSVVLPFSQGYEATTLTEPMRQDKDSHLFQELGKLRQAVIEGKKYTPTSGEGIRYIDGNSFKKEILKSASEQEDFRILAYTNDQVEGYNQFVRKNLYSTTEFREGDPVVAANCCNETTKIEQTYHINHIGDIYNNGFMEVRDITLQATEGIFQIPVDKSAWFKAIKQAEREGKADGQWKHFFTLKNEYLDIRDAFACTVNKSQGSTYEKVFIDLQNISQCRDPYTLTRLIYVAFSRAKKEVIIYRG